MTVALLVSILLQTVIYTVTYMSRHDTAVAFHTALRNDSESWGINAYPVGHERK